MSRRGALHRDVCARDGCGDTTFTQFDTQRDYREFLQRRQRTGQKYWCSRHRNPEQNLRPDNPATTHVLVATRVPSSTGGFLPGLFWYPEGGPQSGSGYTYGPGFNAHGEDFPEGTRLIVTTQIEMPTE